LMTTTCRVSIWPLLVSRKRPARMAITRGAEGQAKIPPSAPTHGVGPAPRQGAGGAAGPPCAHNAAIIKRLDAAVNAALPRITQPPAETNCLERMREAYPLAQTLSKKEGRRSLLAVL